MVFFLPLHPQLLMRKGSLTDMVSSPRYVRTGEEGREKSTKPWSQLCKGGLVLGVGWWSPSPSSAAYQLCYLGWFLSCPLTPFVHSVTPTEEHLQCAGGIPEQGAECSDKQAIPALKDLNKLVGETDNEQSKAAKCMMCEMWEVLWEK